MMNQMKHLIIAAIAVSVIVPGIVCAGGELPPGIQDVRDLKSEFDTHRSNFRKLESQVNEQGDLLASISSEPIEDLFQSLLRRSSLNKALNTAVQDIEELKVIVNSDKASGEWSVYDWFVTPLLGCLGGLSAMFLTKIPKVNRFFFPSHNPPCHRSTNSSSQPSEPVESEVNPRHATQKRTDENDESPKEIRIVKETEKEKGTRSILALCNPDPDVDWSPRTKRAAIRDINEGEIQYFAQGPLGNEAEIKVYLRTKSDGRGGNNLRDLPDPT